MISAALFLVSIPSLDRGDLRRGFPVGFILLFIVSLGFLLPYLAVAVRRLHDTDKSGAMIFIALIPLVGGIILLVFLATEGTSGPNRYGPDPGTMSPGSYPPAPPPPPSY